MIHTDSNRIDTVGPKQAETFDTDRKDNINLDITEHKNKETIKDNKKMPTNFFTKTIRLFGKFSLNIIQVMFFSIFSIAAVMFFICVVIKGLLKKKK